MSFSAILGLWPQLGVLAADIGRPYDTVVAWKRRNSVPVAYWPSILASAERRGIALTQDMLLAAAQRDGGAAAVNAVAAEAE